MKNELEKELQLIRLEVEKYEMVIFSCYCCVCIDYTKLPDGIYIKPYPSEHKFFNLYIVIDKKLYLVRDYEPHEFVNELLEYILE